VTWYSGRAAKLLLSAFYSNLNILNWILEMNQLATTTATGQEIDRWKDLQQRA
jgi:hypothetical protein